MAKHRNREEEIMEFINRQVADKGYPPSVREICAAVGLASPSTVHTYLKKLEAKGLLVKDGSKTRAIRVVGADAEELVGGIQRDEAPFGKNSPMAKACAHGGKLVLMGVSACENPFIPFIESCAGSRDFTSAVARYIDCDGELCTALVEGVPMKKIDCEAFWQEMIARGLKIEAAPYGRTMFYCVDLRSLMEIGTEILKEIK